MSSDGNASGSSGSKTLRHCGKTRVSKRARMPSRLPKATFAELTPRVFDAFRFAFAIEKHVKAALQKHAAAKAVHLPIAERSLFAGVNIRTRSRPLISSVETM